MMTNPRTRPAFLICLVALLVPAASHAQFVDIGAPIPDMTGGSSVWGDYDNDGDLDIFICGIDASGILSHTSVFRNDAGSFIEVSVGLPNPTFANGNWADLDNDGDLDLVLTGNLIGTGFISRIYRNDAGLFNDIAAGLVGMTSVSISFADTDNDGDLDILLAGGGISEPLTKLYRNDNGAFSDTPVNLPPRSEAAVAWGDYDNDNDLDVAMLGFHAMDDSATVYRNDDGDFVSIGVAFTELYSSPGGAEWADYDNDGDLDLALCGGAYFMDSSSIYRNDNGDFVDINAGTVPMGTSSLSWGDYDNDGDADLLMAGILNPGASRDTAIVYRNDSGTFNDIGLSLPGGSNGTEWGDYDNDGDLDFLLMGGSQPGNTTRIYRNDGVVSNTLPSVPTGLTTTVDEGDLIFNWTAASDVETPSGSLSYNLRLGTTPGGSELTPPMAASSGFRRIAATGNANLGLEWKMPQTAIPPQPIYWSVQAVDGSFAGGPFAGEGIAATDLSLGKIASSTVVIPGDTITFSIDVNNIDFVTATNVVVADTLASALTYVSHTATQGTYTPGTGLWDIGTMLGETSDSLDITVVVNPTNQPFQFTNIARIISMDQPDPDPGNNLSSINLLVTTFTEITLGPGMSDSEASFGDYDNDGDLDILTAGNEEGAPSLRLYRNDNSTFVGIPNPQLLPVADADAAWGDYDNDGDLDAVVGGWDSAIEQTRIYRNDNLTLVDTGASIFGTQSSTLDWGDFDNDGDLDLVQTGYGVGPGNILAQLYRNDGGTLNLMAAGLNGVTGGSSGGWGDFDNDGDLDLVLAGHNNSLVPELDLYRNDDGMLTEVSTPILDLNSMAEWGDYDNDGDLDLLVGGVDGAAVEQMLIYRNDSGAFVDIGAALTGVRIAKGAWGDLDGDGDLDVLVTGLIGGSTSSTHFYRNDAGTFVDLVHGLTHLGNGSVDLGDYDNDGDLDAVVTGLNTNGGTVHSFILRNETGTTNTPPLPPTGLTATPIGSQVVFGWSAGSDAETPTAGLTYNLRIGTTPDGGEISAAMAAADGFRRLPAPGNARHNLSWGIDLSALPLPSTVYWGVQSIDAGLAGSAFETTSLDAILQPAIISIVDVGNDQGGQVSIEWRRSAYDGQLAGLTLTGYSIWRRVDPLPAGSPDRKAPAELPHDARSRLRGASSLQAIAASWNYIDTVPARGWESYAYVAPTLCDSTLANGLCLSTFYVSALTSDSLAFWDSPPDSGYSLDNLSPGPPQNLALAASTLTWDPAPDQDVAFHTVYGSGFPTLDGSALQVEQTSSSSADVTGQPHPYYHVTTTDSSGNEGPASSIATGVTGTGDPVFPATTVLHASQPNPFAASTRIRFALAKDGPVELTVLDIQGRLVRRLVQENLSAREHVTTWDGRDQDGVPVASGVYLYRLQTHGFEQTRRLVVVR